MSVDNQTVRNIAFLSRLRIDDNNIDEVQNEFNGILNWASQLEQVNTENVEPLTSVNSQNLVLREDKVTQSNQADAILKNAPASEYGYFVVPKVIKE